MHSSASLYMQPLNALIEHLLILLVFFIGAISDDSPMHLVICG